ncbi:MAG: hydrogenase maturation nickel metallochaperone HypA [Pyrinomonadaceae bacterium]
MHELSIALSIIEGASQEALKRGGAQVHAVHLKLGALSGVVKDALLFSYEIACAGTLLEGSKLVIEDVPVVVYCATCADKKTLESIQRFCCPTCGALTPDVVSGKQLELVGLEITEVSPLREMIDDLNTFTPAGGIA